MDKEAFCKVVFSSTRHTGPKPSLKRVQNGPREVAGLCKLLHVNESKGAVDDRLTCYSTDHRVIPRCVIYRRLGHVSELRRNQRGDQVRMDVEAIPVRFLAVSKKDLSRRCDKCVHECV